VWTQAEFDEFDAANISGPEVGAGMSGIRRLFRDAESGL
jgi:hypothetical protein